MIILFREVDGYLEELGHHQLHENLVRVERVERGGDLYVEASAATMEGDILRMYAYCGALNDPQAKATAKETVRQIRQLCDKMGLTTRRGIIRYPQERPD